MILIPVCDDQLSVFFDSSWGNSFEKNRKSRSGMLAKYGNTVVAAYTNLQKCVSLSSSEVEYVVLSEAIKTVV